MANIESLLAGSLPKSVDLMLDLAACDAVVRVDPAEFENALVNLVLNARDAMPAGGTIAISLTCSELTRAEADRFGVLPGLHALLEVRDNGEGMSEEVRRQAFDPFFSTKPFGTGSGLGLPTVYGCVRRSGGGILIDSTPGVGTTVGLAFPMVDAEPSPQDHGEGGPAADGNGELVLLVEDDVDVADVVRDQLCALGYSVLVTGSTDDALDLVRDVEDIRAVLSDIVMPGQINGLALVAELRKRRPGLPVALMTGYRQGPTQDIQAPDCPVLPKPFSSRLLARTMNEMLAS